MRKKNYIFLSRLLFILIFTLSAFYCKRDIETQENICGQEPCYEGPFEPPWVSGLEYYSPEGQKWTHDNRVLETENFLVFSDASSDEAKTKMGNAAEKALAKIEALFEINSEDLGILDLDSKFCIYTIQRGGNGSSWAGAKGFVMAAYDSALYLNSETYRSIHPRIIEHELTHVVQYNMGGRYHLVHDWFVEGLAEYLSGGVHPPIACWPEVVEWRRDPEHKNPISIEELSQVSSLKRSEHYPLFGLAFRYLVDPRGHGQSMLDVKALCKDIHGGMDFVLALEVHFDMNREYFERNFFELMEAYLPAQCEESRPALYVGPAREIFELPPVDCPPRKYDE